MRLIPMILTALLGLTLATACAVNQPVSDTNIEPLERLVANAAESVKSVAGSPENSAMAATLKEARAVYVFPHLVRAGLIFSMEAGSGVLLSRDDASGWSYPAFCKLSTPSAGLQAGWQESQLVLAIMNDKTFNQAVNGQLSLGAQAAWTWGNSGDEAASDVADVIAFTDSKGYYAGLTLEGLNIFSRESSNKRYYDDHQATPSAILVERGLENPQALPLVRALNSL